MAERLSLPRSGHVFVWGVVTLGGAVLALSLTQLVAAPQPYWLIVLALTVLSGPLALRVPSTSVTVTVSDTFVFAALVWFGPAAAAVTIALDGLLVSLRAKRREPGRLLFNMSEPALAIWLAGQLFFWLAGETPLFGRSVPFGPLIGPLLAMTASYFLLNAGFSLMAIWFETGMPPRQFLHAHLAHLGPVYLANVLLVGLLALNSDNVTFTAFWVLVPVLVFTYAVAKLAIERRATLDALRENEARFRELAENISEVLWTVDAVAQRVLYLSPAYGRIWGRPAGADESGWLDRFQHVHEEDRDRARSAFETGAPQGTYDIEYRVEHPSGEIRWIHDRGFPVKSPGGEVRRIVGIAEDITDRRQLEQRLLQAQKMEGIGRMAGGVAHDFRNILTAVLGYSEILLEQLDARGPQWSAALKIRQASGRAAELTSQLLAFSRRQVLRLEVISVNDLVAEVEDMLLRLMPDDIEIELRLDDDRGCVKADAARLEQVIVNLVVNARDAMPDGGRLVIATENSTLTGKEGRGDEPVQPGRYVKVSVSDTGTGMDERTVTRIFEPFFTTKEQGKGTGLGLATAYGTVRQLGGHMFVDSAVGRGSQFSIYLPRTDELPEAVVADVKDHRGQTGTETVLLVEDEASVREFAATVLSEAGYRVLDACGGEPALAIAAGLEHAPDLVVTDVVMPVMTGGELAKRMRTRYPGLPVLFISGYGASSAQEHGIDTVRDVLLEKPFGPDALLRTVRDVLDAASRASPARTTGL